MAYDNGGLLHIDSMGHYNTATMARKWTQYNTNSSFTAIEAAHTAGSAGSLHLSGPGFAYVTLTEEQPTLTVKFRYTFDGLGTSAPICRFFNAGAIGVNTAFDLQSVGDGRVRMFVWERHVASSASTYVFNSGIDYYIMMKVTAAKGASTYQLTYNIYVNSTTNNILSGTIDSGWPNSLSNFDGWASYEFFPEGWVEDIAVTKTELFGDIHIACLFPNAAGDLTEWTPNPVVPNWENVSAHVPGDVDYNEAGSTGLRDLYNMDDLGSTSVTIFGCQEVYAVEKSNAGPGSYVSQQKTHATIYEGIEFFPSADVFAPFDCVPRRKNPNTGADYTPAEINAIQLGPKRVT